MNCICQPGSNKDTKIIKPQKITRQYERESNVIYQIETFQSDKKKHCIRE